MSAIHRPFRIEWIGWPESEKLRLEPAELRGEVRAMRERPQECSTSLVNINSTKLKRNGHHADQ